MNYSEKKEIPKLRDYQEKVINILCKMEEKYNNYSTLIELSTGAGKTYLTTRFILKQAINKGNKVLWLAHRDFLLEQAYNTLQSCFTADTCPTREQLNGLKISSTNSNISGIEEDTDIVYASINSLRDIESSSNNLFTWLKSSQEGDKKLFIIIDEAHHVGSAIYNSFLNQVFTQGCVRSYALIGLTATPFRGDYEEINLFKWFKHGYVEDYKPDDTSVDTSKLTSLGNGIGDLTGILEESGSIQRVLNKGNKISTITLADLVKIGVVLEPDFIRIDDYNYTDKQDNSKDIITSVAKNISKTDNLGKTVIFVSKIDEVTALVKELKKYALGYYISDLTSKTKNREEIIEKFKQEDNAIIVTVDVISEGFDIKDINTIVLVDATNSNIRLRQRIGRVVRSSNIEKDCRVIWYYYQHSSDTIVTSHLGYSTEKRGYNLNRIQDENSKKSDIERKTYYLTAPQYIEPVGYLEKYNCKDSREYQILLDILTLFKDQSEIKDAVGYFDLGNDNIIYVDNILKEGIEQLQRRVYTEYQILKDIKSCNPVTSSDLWGTNNNEYIKNVMEICFFLCNPSEKATFYITKENIEDLILYMLSHNCKLPDFNNCQATLLNLVNAVFDDDSENSIDNKEIIINQIVENAEYKQMIKGNEILLRSMLETCVDAVLKQRQMSAELANEEADAKTSEISSEAEQEGNHLSLEEKESIKVSELYRVIITKKYDDLYKNKRGTESLTRRNTLRMKSGAFDAHLDSLKRVKMGYTWSKDFVTCKCSKCNKDKPVVGMTFNTSTKKLECRDCNAQPHKIICIRNFSGLYDTEVLAQSLINNYQHLVVSEEDINELKDTLDAVLKAFSINGVDLNALVNDVICAIAYTSNINSIVYQRLSLSDLTKTLKDLSIPIPRYIGYLLYDIVYRNVSSKINFIKKDEELHYISDSCQNEQDLLSITQAVLKEYNVDYQDLLNLNLEPLRDAITDTKPYIKVLKHYLGIKPNFLCRMNNFIINQAVGVDTYLSGCGGSGADLINIRTNKTLSKKVYNEYGYGLTNFYSMLSDRNSLEVLINKVELFVDCILNPAIYKDKIEKDFGSRLLGKVSDLVYLKEKTAQELGVEARESSSSSSFERERNKLFKNPILRDRYVKDDTLDEDLYKKEVEVRENILFGIYKRCSELYSWLQDSSDDKIEEANILNVDLAFCVYIYLSFADREFFNQCLLYYFLQFASTYKSKLMMGYDFISKCKINTDTRDINDLLKSGDYEDKESCIAYCDIPYAETTTDMYVSDCFDFKKFITALNTFKGYYTVSSRYNICAESDVKRAYKKLDGVVESNTDNLDNKVNRLKKKASSILDFYKNFCSKTDGGTMTEDRSPKYIIIPFTSAEEKEDDSKGRVIWRRIHNNYRLSIKSNDIEKMFKNTILSNIPVEVMITNIDMLNKANKDTEDYKLLSYYEIVKDNAYAIPTAGLNVTDTNYVTEPVYLVLKYQYYIEMMNNIIYEEENALLKAKETADMFRHIYKLEN